MNSDSLSSDPLNFELMKVVERAVRPVRATKQRKLRMRQELLAHVTALYEEERSRWGDDAAALREASRRFGDPAELSQELDRSVGFWSRWAWGEERIVDSLDRVSGYRPDRSFAWHLGRAFLTAIVSGVLVAVLVSLVSLLVPDRPLVWREAAGLLTILVYFMGMTFVLHGTAISLVGDFYDRDRPRWDRVALRVVLCVVAMTLLFFGMHAAIHDVRPLLWQLPIIVCVHALIPLGLILAVRSAERRARPYREWTRLRLDE